MYFSIYLFGISKFNSVENLIWQGSLCFQLQTNHTLQNQAFPEMALLHGRNCLKLHILHQSFFFLLAKNYEADSIIELLGSCFEYFIVQSFTDALSKLNLFNFNSSSTKRVFLQERHLFFFLQKPHLFS